MDELKQWLVRRPQLREIFPNLFVLVPLLVILVYIGQLFAQMFITKARIETNSGTTSVLVNNLSFFDVFLYVGLIGPILEEIQFRLFPFSVIFLLFWLTGLRKTALYMPVICLCVMATSIVFGNAHGSGGIFMQGPLGLAFSLVFLKWSGLGEGLVATLKGCAAAIALHSSYNVTVLAVAFMHRS